MFKNQQSIDNELRAIMNRLQCSTEFLNRVRNFNQNHPIKKQKAAIHHEQQPLKNNC